MMRAHMLLTVLPSKSARSLNLLCVSLSSVKLHTGLLRSCMTYKVCTVIYVLISYDVYIVYFIYTVYRIYLNDKHTEQVQYSLQSL